MWATDYADFTDWDSSATNNTNHTNILPRNILPRITQISQISQKGRANAKDLFEQIKGTSILVLIRVIRGICGYVGHE